MDVLIATWENFQAILKILPMNYLFHLSISQVLLKSLPDPFIFSIAIDVEKMEIQ